jgi:hypothetical protein
MEVGGIAAGRAAELAEPSAGRSQPRRLFLNDKLLRELPCSARPVLAHELTHAAQYELSGGRWGQSEQWLRPVLRPGSETMRGPANSPGTV